MTDTRDEFDETLRRAVADYHRPPDVAPREDMWAAIQARRSPTLALVPDAAAPRMATVDTARRARRSALPARAWWMLAAAASVLLGAGIGIGRWTSRGWTAAPTGLPVTAAVGQRTPATATPSATTGAGAPVMATIEPAVPREAAPREAAPRVARRPAAGSPPPRSEGRDEDAGRGANVTYTIATLRHLTEVEALLVSFHSEAADSVATVRLSVWARDLVRDTRLLLDSPAAADPRRRRLLEDLEMVLVQLVQLDESAPARAGALSEREMIDRSLGRGALLTRLRSAIPAGT